MKFQFNEQQTLELIEVLEEHFGKPMEQWEDELKRVGIKLNYTETGEPIGFSREEQDEFLEHAKAIATNTKKDSIIRQLNKMFNFKTHLLVR